MVESDIKSDLVIAMRKIKAQEAEIHNLKCQLSIMQEKYDDLWITNKIQMSKIVEYRRLIEHYEDGAPLYVSTAN